MKFQQLLFKIDEKIGDDDYGEAAIYIANHLDSIYGVMNRIKNKRDEFAAHVIQMFNLYLRKDEKRLQAYIDRMEKEYFETLS